MQDYMQQKFYHFTAFKAGRAHRVAVWNGVRSYESQPPPEIVSVLGGGKVSIVQISKPMGVHRSAFKTLDALLEKFDVVIFWTRDTRTYRSMVEEFRRTSTLTIDGLPKL